MAVSHRHHFVPQGFLRGFEAVDAEASSHIWVYSKTPDRAPRLKAIRSIAWLPSYYNQEGTAGEIDDRLETKLAQTVDNEVPRLIANLRVTSGRAVELGEKERGHLAYFVGLSLTRVPSFRDGIEAMNTWAAQSVLSRKAADDPELASFVDKHGVTASAKTSGSLEAMLMSARQIAESALRKSWQFYVPPRDVPLVTSDNPVHFSGRFAKLKQLGPGHPQAELIINLRHNLALVCTPIPDAPHLQAFALSPSEARKFNRGTVIAARDRVFANRKSAQMDDFVKKYAGIAQRLAV